MEYLTSLNNNRIKNIAKLVKSSRFRRERGAFVAEGLRLVSEIPENRIRELYIEESFYEKLEAENGFDERLMNLMEAAEEQRECFLVSEAVMKKLSDTDTPQGILAVVDMMGEESDNCTADDVTNESANEQLTDNEKKNALNQLMGGNTEKPFIIILDNLQDPGNMGTIIRTAEGAGVTGILISGNSVDPFSPKVVRATMGSLFRMNICISDDLMGDIEKLKKERVTVFGTHLSGKEFYDEDFTVPAAFLIGNEGRGLSDEVSATADRLLRIPMKGSVESLNAGVSAAVVMYEVLRQRR